MISVEFLCYLNKAILNRISSYKIIYDVLDTALN